MVSDTLEGWFQDAPDRVGRARLLAEVEQGLFGGRRDATHVGRYRIERRLGGGGQGVVYVARDPALDRRVAVKLMHVDTHDDPLAYARLLREASALAQLAHPNVVAINDVGECEAGIYLVTELVEGQTLAQWLEGAKRSREAIMSVFMQAGAGLVAAHACGIVHRDFKPANVLVAEDGRVRLLDFGLARGQQTYDALPPAPVASTTTRASTPTQLTASGSVMGTPAYMAPEQWQGTSDIASDQFAFGVSLFEAVYGRRPFDVQLDGSHFTGRPVPRFPAGNTEPAWLRRALARMLAIDPDDRFADMRDALAALARRRRPRGRWILGGVAVAALAGLVFAEHEPTPCDRDPLAARGVWDDARRLDVRRAFASSGVASAEATATRVTSTLDGWAAEFTETRRRACEAIFAADDVPVADATLDVRMQCLDRRLDELDALVGVFTEADDTVVTHAALAVDHLTRPARCTDDANGAEPVPDDPQLRARVLELRRDLSRAIALYEAGRKRDSLELAQAVLAATEEVDYPPLAAEARFRVATGLEATGRYQEAVTELARAHEIAVASRHDRLAAWAAVTAVFVHGHRLADPDQARVWQGYAAAALSTIDPAHELHVLLPSNVATVALRQGDPARALPQLRRAAELVEARGITGHIAGLVHNNLAIAHVQLGQLDEALAELQTATRIWQDTVGPEHPHVATAESNLCGIASELARYDEALAHAQTALRVHALVNGPEHPETAAARLNLATVYTRTGRYAEGEAQARQALHLRLAAYGELHPTVVDNYNTLGFALEAQGKSEAALAAYATAIEIAERVYPAGHVGIAPALSNSARALLSLGRVDEAVLRSRRAVELYRASNPEHAHAAFAMTSLGLSLLARGDAEAAADILAEALARRELSEHDARLRAETRFALARARAQLGDADTARALADEARDELRMIGERGAADLADVEAWRSGHPA